MTEGFEFFKEYIGEIVTALVIAPISGWLADIRSKRKLSAEVKSQELENIEKGLGIYKDMIDTLRKEMQNQHDENAKEIERLKRELEESKEHWQSKYNNLKADFEAYKQKHP